MLDGVRMVVGGWLVGWLLCWESRGKVGEGRRRRRRSNYRLEAMGVIAGYSFRLGIGDSGGSRAIKPKGPSMTAVAFTRKDSFEKLTAPISGLVATSPSFCTTVAILFLTFLSRPFLFFF